MERIRFLGLVLGFLSFLVYVEGSSSVLAIADPDTPIEVNSVRVFRNFTETGDQIYIIEQDIPYGSEPSEDPRDAFRVGIHDGTSLVYTAPIVYYNHSLSAIYLTAVKALTWEATGYRIYVSANPSFFTVTAQNSTNLPILAPNWIDGTLVTTPGLVGAHILDIVRNLEGSSGLDLLTNTNKLNTAGADIVESTVVFIRDKVPTIFATSSAFPSLPTPTFLKGGEATYTANQGARLSGSLETLGLLVAGKPGLGPTIGTFLYFILIFSVMGAVLQITKDITATTVGAGLPMVLVGSVVGILSMSLVFGMFFLVLILFGITFILGRMG